MYDLSQVKVSNSPHIRSEDSTRQIMLDVIIGLIPALALAIFVFGARALVVTAVSVIGFVILLICASIYMVSTLKKGEE